MPSKYAYRNTEKYKLYHRKNVLDNQRRNGAARRTRDLRHLYGITQEDKRQLYIAQNGICALCNKPLPEDYRKAAIDHCHKTGKIRSLLHRTPCNNGLGWIENVEFLQQALAYLALHKAEEAVAA